MRRRATLNSLAENPLDKSGAKGPGSVPCVPVCDCGAYRHNMDLGCGAQGCGFVTVVIYREEQPQERSRRHALP